MQGAPSDVVFELVEIPDQQFTRVHNDLKMNMEISLEEVNRLLFRQSWASAGLSSTWMAGKWWYRTRKSPSQGQ